MTCVIHHSALISLSDGSGAVVSAHGVRVTHRGERSYEPVVRGFLNKHVGAEVHSIDVIRRPSGTTGGNRNEKRSFDDQSTEPVGNGTGRRHKL